MSLNNKIWDIFRCLFKDGKFIFIVLATLLATFPIIANYTLKTSSYCLEKSLIVAIPFAFAWVVFAWAITDQSVLRRFTTYAFIFVVLFFEKIYWGVFNYLYASNNLSELIDTKETAHNIFILIEFIAMFAVFFTLWRLAKPKEFKNRNLKSISLVVLSAFLMTIPLWIFRFLRYIGAESFTRFLIENIEWYGLLLEGIPIAFSLIVFAIVITNIKESVKNLLYFLIFVFALVMYLPVYSGNFPEIVFFIIVGFCYFVVFLSLVLVSKTKYIEQ